MLRRRISDWFSGGGGSNDASTRSKDAFALQRAGSSNVSKNSDANQETQNASAEKAFLALHHHRIDEIWNAYFATSSKRPLPRLTAKQKPAIIGEYDGRLADM